MTGTSAMPPRVLLAHDRALRGEQLGTRLLKEGRVEVVGRVAGPEAMLDSLRSTNADVVLLELSGMDLDGLDTVRMLRMHAPAVGVLVSAVHPDKTFVLESIRAGAHGCIVSASSPCHLIEAIHQVSEGRHFFSPEIAGILAGESAMQVGEPQYDRRVNLSRRENQVLELVAAGLSNREIAAELALSVRTVESHRLRLTKKLGAHGTASLVKIAMTHSPTDRD